MEAGLGSGAEAGGRGGLGLGVRADLGRGLSRGLAPGEGGWAWMADSGAGEDDRLVGVCGRECAGGESDRLTPEGEGTRG